MSWHAVDAVDDAIGATRRFLFPFSLVRWTKLAFLVLLMGGGGGASADASLSAVSEADVTSPQGVGWDSVGVDPNSVEIGPGSVTLRDLAGSVDPVLLAALVGGTVLLIAAVSVASLSLRLVFYDALRTNDVRIWRPFRSRLRQSLGLFLFTAVLGLVAAAPVALAVVVATAADAPIGWEPIDSFAGAIASLSIGPTVVLGLLGAVLVVIASLALRFTYEFVVPTMIVEETGTLGGWRRFWTTLRTEWTEFLLYLVVHVVVSLGLSVVEGIAAVVAFALVATVAGLALLFAAVALGGLGALVGTTAGMAALALVSVVALAVLLALVLPVRVVTRTYRIAYEVSTLGGIDPDLVLLHSDLGSEFPTPSEPDPVDSRGR